MPDWQQAASSVLVSLGVRWPNQIMDELLKRFESGSLPHYFVMKTLGDFVAANGNHSCFYPFSSFIITS